VKKYIILAFVIIFIFIFASCTIRDLHLSKLDFDDSGKIVDNKIENILEAMEHCDKNALKNLFSQKAIKGRENFDETVIELFDFFEGQILSHSRCLPYEEYGRNVDSEYRCLCAYTDVETNKQQYRLAFKIFIEDTSDSDNVGIYSLYIIKSEYSDSQKAYWGNGNWVEGDWNPGINIDRTKNND
jgi:hypothetical protein